MTGPRERPEDHAVFWTSPGRKVLWIQHSDAMPEWAAKTRALRHNVMRSYEERRMGVRYMARHLRSAQARV